MSFLSKLFGGGKTESVPASASVPVVQCPHLALIAKWDSVADMGIEEKATSFECESCHESFTPEEARVQRGSNLELFKPPETNN